MLSYALAIAVAISSLALFSTAFLMSDIHRQDDFLWSTVGLFYALVLWFCARNITGAVLLGQASASILLVSYSWQTLKLRKALANPERAAEINNFSILRAVNGLLARKKPQATIAKTPSVTSNPKVTEKVTESEIPIPDTPSTSDRPSTIPPKKDKIESEPNQQSEQPETTATDTRSDNSSPETEKVTAPPTTPPQVRTEPQSTEDETTADTEIANIQDSVTDKAIPEVVMPEVQKEPEASETTPTAEPPIVAPSTTDITEEKPAPESAIAPSVEETTPTAKAEAENAEGGERLTQEIASNNPAPLEPQPESTAPPTPVVEEINSTKPKTKDDLDSLETVEVAEVLEAVPEDRSNKNNEDKTNIIEVTTTEIDPDSPESKTKPNSD